MALTALGVNGLNIKEETVLQSKRVLVTSAQLLALNATPQTLVEAFGSDTVTEFVSAVVYKPAGTAYAGVASGENLAIKYTDGSGAQVCTDIETIGFLDQTTAQTRIARPIVTEYTPVQNAAIVLHLLSGEITTGTSPLVVTVYYRVFKNVSVESTK